MWCATLQVKRVGRLGIEPKNHGCDASLTHFAANTAGVRRQADDDSVSWGARTRRSEVETLVGFSEPQRATFAWECGELDADGLSKRPPSSELTLGRLLKHLAYLEDLNFTGDLGGSVLAGGTRAAISG